MDLTSEIIWGRYALNQKKITRSQLQTCIEQLGHLKEKGVEKTLFDIMLGNGFIDKKVARQIRRLEGMIPGYTMDELIGSGGVGIVYKAYSLKNNSDVAIKILNPEYTDNSIVLNRFLREIEISKKLDHPNIVRGIDSGRIDDLYYLALEYVDGPNLATHVSETKPLSEKALISVLVNVTRALYYSWRKGLTHRDIKPENLILMRSGVVKVCDFGLAKLTDVNIALTVSGTIVGSPYYISPEQVNDSLTLDYRSDIYSLGASLYYLVTGKVVFEEKNMITVCNAHTNKLPVPPSKYVSLSPGLEKLILRMLSKNPEDRCRSPKEFVSQVNAVTRTLKEGSKSKKRHKVSGRNLDPITPTRHGGEPPDVIRKVLEKHGGGSEIHAATKIRSEGADSSSRSSTSKESIQGKTEDSMLQHLLLSLNLMDMSQLSECMSVQVDLQLQGIPKSLAEIIVDQGHVTQEYIQNLRYLRDEDGTTLLPGYEIIKIVGQGGITIVYLARNVSTNETIALKVFAPGTSENSSTIARFIREAQAAKKLNHPNIVKAYEVGTVHGVYYLVMEYVSGLTLSQIITKIGRLEEQKALDILEQIADALTYAWEQNIIHRDIKPGNILSDGQRIKICDLGLAKALESEIELTQEGSILGTPQFMSPEQFQSNGELDFRTDVYSLGVTFYVMLTGNLPFSTSTKIGLAQAHIAQTPPALEKFNCKVSGPTKALLHKMLAKDPTRRAHDKRELLEDIRRVRSGDYPKNTLSRTIFKRVAVIMVALLLLVGVAMVALLLLASDDPKIRAEISALIAARQYQQARAKILASSLQLEQKEHLLRALEQAEAKQTQRQLARQREKLRQEISLLIAAGKFGQAKNKILQDDLALEEKQKLLTLMTQAENKQQQFKVLQITPPQGARLYRNKIELSGRVECSSLEAVLVNDRRATTRQQDGGIVQFYAEIPLVVGRNRLPMVFILKGGHQEIREHVLWREVPDQSPPCIVLTVPSGIIAGKSKKFTDESLLLEGYVTDNRQVKSITINGGPAFSRVVDAKTIFSFHCQLQEGRQPIRIIAIDDSNNQAIFEFYAYLRPKGWFDEQMPPGLTKEGKYGEYRWSKDNSIMVYVPAGHFAFGVGNAQEVYLPAFYIDKYEVTWQQYKKFCDQNNRPLPRRPSWGVRAMHPVVFVSPDDAQAYAFRFGKKLPTVKQWTKAARGGMRIPDWPQSLRPISLCVNPIPRRTYPWGDELPNATRNGEKVYRCNYCADDSFVGQASDGYMYSARVGDFPQWDSPYHCSDMAGNVFEICRDIAEEGYRIRTGGSFHSLAGQCTIEYRTKIAEKRGDSQTGFRLVKELERD